LTTAWKFKFPCNSPSQGTIEVAEGVDEGGGLFTYTGNPLSPAGRENAAGALAGPIVVAEGVEEGGELFRYAGNPLSPAGRESAAGALAGAAEPAVNKVGTKSRGKALAAVPLVPPSKKTAAGGFNDRLKPVSAGPVAGGSG
jgi:hypothetical protein